MSRLTKRKTDTYIRLNDGVNMTPFSCGWEAIKKLADLEDLEEEGRLIKLPCKIGTWCYCLRCSWNGYNIDKKKFKLGMLEKFNKTVFLTKEEAEKALEQMKKDEE